MLELSINILSLHFQTTICQEIIFKSEEAQVQPLATHQII